MGKKQVGSNLSKEDFIVKAKSCRSLAFSFSFFFLCSLWSLNSPTEVIQSCPTLCDPMDCSLPGSSIHGFSRQEYWSRLSFPSPGDHPDPEIELWSSSLQEDPLLSEPLGNPPIPAKRTFSEIVQANVTLTKIRWLRSILILWNNL